MPDRTEKPLIRIIDDDPELCEAQSIYIRYCGLDCVTYPTADQFLAQDDLSRPGCLILDVEMPGMNGLTLQQEMGRRGIDLPILFLSAQNLFNLIPRARVVKFSDGIICHLIWKINE